MGKGYFALPTTSKRKPRAQKPPAPVTISPLVKQVRKWVSEAADGDRDNRVKALDDLKFLIGEEQWDPTAKASRAAGNRPTLTVNKLPKFVRQVVGQYRGQRFVPRTFPKDGDADDAVAEVYSGLLRFIIYASNAEMAFTNGLKYGASCGMGYWRVEPRYVSDEIWDQELVVNPIIDPFTVYIDPRAKRLDLLDARYVIVTSLVPKSEFEKLYPGKVPSSIEGGDGNDSDNFWEMINTHSREVEYRVAEVWWRIEKERTLCLLSNGETIDVTDKDEEEIKGLLVVKTEEAAEVAFPDLASLDDREKKFAIYNLLQTGQLIPVGKVRTRKKQYSQIKTALFSGIDQLTATTDWPGKYFTIIPCYGEVTYYEGKPIRKGLIRDGKDAQKMYNYTISQMVETYALTPKQPYLVDMGSIEEYKEIWDSAGKGNSPYLPYNAKPGYPAPQRGKPVEVPSAALSIGHEAHDALTDTIGMFEPSFGAPSNETSGKAIQLRIQQGTVTSNLFADNMRFAVEHTAAVLIDLFPHYYDSQRVIRILDQDEKTMKLVGINGGLATEQDKSFDMTKGKYSVIITTGPSYATRNAEKMDSLIQFMQYLPPELAGQISPEIAKAGDWADSDAISEKLESLTGTGVTPEVMQAIQQAVMQTIQQLTEQQGGGEGSPQGEPQ